jgi:hypothetical protein
VVSTELAAKMIEDVQCELGVGLNENQGDNGEEEDEKDEEEKERMEEEAEHKKEEEEKYVEHRRIELEEKIRCTRHMGSNDILCC